LTKVAVVFKKKKIIDHKETAEHNAAIKLIADAKKEPHEYPYLKSLSREI
jgi:hypothetical protein